MKTLRPTTLKTSSRSAADRLWRAAHDAAGALADRMLDQAAAAALAGLRFAAAVLDAWSRELAREIEHNRRAGARAADRAAAAAAWKKTAAGKKAARPRVPRSPAPACSTN